MYVLGLLVLKLPNQIMNTEDSIKKEFLDSLELPSRLSDMIDNGEIPPNFAMVLMNETTKTPMQLNQLGSKDFD